MATKTELELRVKGLEWAISEIHKHTVEADAAYKKLGYGNAGDLALEEQPYYVTGALNARLMMIAAMAEYAVPSIMEVV